MASDKLEAKLADIREFSRQFKEGGWDEAVEGFRCLVDRLLRMTVMDDKCFVRTVRNKDNAESPRILAGPDGVTDSLTLNNGAFLRLIVDLAWDGIHLRVAESTFQYQADAGGNDWFFRFDFLRNRPSEKPEAHVHVRGSLTDSFKSPHDKWTLEDVHFPTAERVSIESVIRLLADDFAIPCNVDDDIDNGDEKTEKLWRAVLRESEKQGFF